MASVPFNPGLGPSRTSPLSETPPVSMAVPRAIAEAGAAAVRPFAPREGKASPPEPPLLRFGLRQLFWFVTAMCGLLAVMAVLEPIVALVLLLGVLVVAAHVFGTALGRRLRNLSDSRRRWEAGLQTTRTAGDDSAEPARPARGVSIPALGRRSPLHVRRTSLRWLPRLIGAGILTGGLGGATLLFLLVGERTSTAGLAVGAISMAVLGGWFAFLGGSFVGILRHGWSEAVAAENESQTPRGPLL